jgi:error-prone DNA polymerase
VTYIELRTASAFSFLFGASLPEDLVTRAAELGYPALALLDRDGVYGAPRFYAEARRTNLRAIVGADIPIDNNSRIGLLATDRRGYQHLCRLITAGKLGRQKGEIAITTEMLEAHAPGLIALVDGEDPHLDVLQALFPGRLYVEIQRHLDATEERRTQRALAIAARRRLPVVATNGVRQARQQDADLADVLTCIREKTTLDAAGRRLAPNAERYLKSPREMALLFRDQPRALAATLDIAARCTFTLEDLGYKFPTSPVPDGETEYSYLAHLVHEGARRRYRPVTPKVAAQIQRELDLIARLDLAGYFLIVWDLVEFCRKNGILTQGRGSAANSAVCYALGITAVDPIGMELLFERFLSEERGEWPDIDLDLPSGDQREKVIQYVYQKYQTPGGGLGERAPRVAMTANVITYRARSAVREVGKTLGFSLERLDALSKRLSAFEYRTSEDEVAQQLASAGFSLDEPRVRQLMRMTAAIQGLPRHLGQHSGGMVLCHGRLDEIVPLEPAAMPGRTVVQWDKDDCADLGIIKVDLLGLGMMAVLEEAVPMVKRYEGNEIDLAHLPPDDPETYRLLRAADTVGVFQVESRVQMATLPRMQPRKFYDIVVEVALIRPGPIVGQMVHPYMKRRAGREPVTYAHPSLEPILARTLGVPLFQEQLMRIAMVAAGFTGGQAEELRRAMGNKRSVEKMAALEKALRDGMAARGIVGRAQDDIVQGIRAFALYGFPESHAASFALIVYASAYRKAHHPAVFCAALLNNWPMGFYHPATLIADAKRHGVRVLPIDVTRSEWKCTLEPEERGGRWPHAIRIGLRYVAGLREETAKRLEAARAERPFSSLADFWSRVQPSPREVSTLAAVGALNHVGGDRARDRRGAAWSATALGRSGALFASTGGDDPAPLDPMTLVERLSADYMSSGMTVGPHPMSLHRRALARRGILAAAELGSRPHGTRVRTAGAVIVRQRPGTAKGFFFVTLEDETGFGNIIIEPAQFSAHRAVLLTSAALVVEGVLQNVDNVVGIKADRFEPLSLVTGEVPSRDFR